MGFSVSLDPAAEGGPPDSGSGEPRHNWLELLASGLTYDLVGLAPGPPCDLPPRSHAYGLEVDPEAVRLEVLTLSPGPHLAGGHVLLPVVRSLAWLGAVLTAIDGIEAVAWNAARCWSGPAYFRESVLRWIEGGVFPSLGLTALALDPDGGMHSEGLTLFTGQELRLEPELTSDKAAGAKIGIRLIDHLVKSGRVGQPQSIPGPSGTPLRLEPSANGRFVRVWRG